MVTTAPASLLPERDGELVVLGELLARVRVGEGAVAVIAGSPGIGKTALLRATVDLATGHGFTVLRARESQLEQGFSFGVAQQLLERRVPEAPPAKQQPLLAGVAKDARSALGLGGAPTDSELRSTHGLYWLIANLAAQGPLLLTVDDAHWADRSSLRWLVYSAQRLTGLSLAILATSRLSEPGAEQDLLDALALDDAAKRSRPLRYRPGTESPSRLRWRPVRFTSRSPFGSPSDPRTVHDAPKVRN